MIHESRKQALMAGADRYFTGKPCKRGNVDFRYSATGGCLCSQCKKARNDSCKRHYANNKPYYERKWTEFYKNNSESVKERRRERGAKNREKEALLAKTYYWMNREKCIASSLDYAKRKPWVQASIQSTRNRAKKQATPAWASKEKIKLLFKHADLINCWPGPKAQVDHIVPLKSKIVCGLHCEQNLQLLWDYENMKKSNRYWPDMPEVLRNEA